MYLFIWPRLKYTFFRWTTLCVDCLLFDFSIFYLDSTNNNTEPWPPGSCRISELPKHAYVPGHQLNDLVRNGYSVLYSCHENYDGSVTIKCSDGSWIGELLECKATCDHRKLFSITFVPNCTFQDGPFECACSQSYSGTIAKIICAEGYENVHSEEQAVTCGDDGEWSTVPTDCQWIGGKDLAGLDTQLIIRSDY